MIEAEIIRPLRLALIAYNSKQALEGLKIIAKNNEDRIKHLDRTELLFKDGTKIIALFDDSCYIGKKFDQLVIFDDARMNVSYKKRDFIAEILYHCVCPVSCIPEQYRILKYLYF